MMRLCFVQSSNISYRHDASYSWKQENFYSVTIPVTISSIKKKNNPSHGVVSGVFSFITSVYYGYPITFPSHLKWVPLQRSYGSYHSPFFKGPYLDGILNTVVYHCSLVKNMHWSEYHHSPWTVNQ